MNSMMRQGSILFDACWLRKWSLAFSLVRDNVGIHYVDEITGNSVLQIVVKNNGPLELVKLLIRKGLKTTLCLPIAVQANVSAALVQTLITVGNMNINQQDEFGRTVLHFIDYDNCSLHLLNVLLEAGADINRADCNGLTPLMNAVIKNSSLFVLIMAKNGGDPRKKNKQGKNSIDLAEKKPHLKICLEKAVVFTALCSARVISRLDSKGKALIRLLPVDLIRVLNTFLF